MNEAKKYNHFHFESLKSFMNAVKNSQFNRFAVVGVLSARKLAMNNELCMQQKTNDTK